MDFPALDDKRGCVISLNNGSRRRAESPKALSPGRMGCGL
jgi:hypothetical protein